MLPRNRRPRFRVKGICPQWKQYSLFFFVGTGNGINPRDLNAGRKRFLAMLVNGCSSPFRAKTMSSTSNPVVPHNSVSARILPSSPNFTSSIVKSLWQRHPELGPCPLAFKCQQRLNVSASSTSLFGDHVKLWGLLPAIPRQSRPYMTPRASKDVPYSYRYPPMTKKPRWWWRTLACLPYLMPLHETWMYAETAYHLHPFLEDFEFVTYPFLGALGRLPSWFLMAYFFVAYLGVVRRKEWPHFFRFHVVMGMLLEIALQVVGTVSRWMPLAAYWGKVGMHFWTAIAFAYLFTVLESIRCALAGMYADIPFVCDAAYIQIPYD